MCQGLPDGTAIGPARRLARALRVGSMMRSVPILVLAAACGLWALGCRCERPPRGECEVDEDCLDDGRFCTGPPTCEISFGRGVCRPSADPCAVSEGCDEVADECVFCGTRPDHPACLDAGPPPDGGLTCDERASGTACFSDSECVGECQGEAPVQWRTVGAAGGEGRPLSAPFFPGGYCAERCDARALNDPCGDCATCNGDALLGNVRLPIFYAGAGSYEPTDGVCRRDCAPSDTGTGCPREGYACDPETRTCMEACVDDQQCQIVLRDQDGDGAVDVVDRGTSFPAYCDHVTGRCRTRGLPGAEIGDPCRDDDECPADGRCFFNGGGEQGICGLPGCRGGLVECPEGTACDVRNIDGGAVSACLPACRVGREDGSGDMLGAGSGHPECGPGYACVWNGTDTGPGDASGSCVPGEYNDVTTPNVGRPCVDDDQCYSPFGYGECYFSEDFWNLPSGMCTVRHCGTFLNAAGEEVDGLLPGVEISMPICDPMRGEECVALGSRAAVGQTYCLERCTEASDCQAGFACPELLSGRTYCWPFCYLDLDCPAGRRCLDAMGQSCAESGGSRCRCE